MCNMVLSFNELPEAVGKLYTKLENIERLLSLQQYVQPEADPLLLIDEAAILTHLSVQTIYGKVSKKEIPHIKNGKRLFFSQKDLTDWIRSGRKKTTAEITSEADQFLASKRIAK